MLNYIKKEFKTDTYWANTSGNDLVKDVVMNGNGEVKEGIRQLMLGNSVEVPINQYIVLSCL